MSAAVAMRGRGQARPAAVGAGLAARSGAGDAPGATLAVSRASGAGDAPDAAAGAGDAPGTAWGAGDAPGTASAIYTGTIHHRRAEPRQEFSHRLALAYIDLGELPALLGGRLLHRHAGLLRFRARDYLGRGAAPLQEAVRDRVAQLGGERPTGPIRLLTQLRAFGLCFNPVSFYYCFEPGGHRLQSVLAEVTNTPWGERGCYLLAERDLGSPVLQGRFAKELHVSPFMGMDHVYHARASTPGPRLWVHIDSLRRGATVFGATLALERRSLTHASAAALSARFPFATARTLSLIYGHALGLKLAGARYHPHPGPDRGARA